MKFRKIEKTDTAKTDRLFRACLADLLKREGIDDKKLFEEEVSRLNEAVQKSIRHSRNRFYLAEENNEILGTIALQVPGPMLNSMVEVELDQFEVACVYVHPAYQRQGVGNFLFQNVCKELMRFGKSKFYLDAGFTSSQRYWLEKLGEPSRLLENYWGEGKPHMVWLREIE